MENKLYNVLDELVERPNVVGAGVSGQNGLCIALKGSLSSLTVSDAQSMIKDASKLSSTGEIPEIFIETSDTLFLIGQKDQLTTTIVYNQSESSKE